jgi:guanylate kinase
VSDSNPHPANPKIARRGILFLVSAPSGTGKSTLLQLLQEHPDFEYSVSCTTRPPRAGEVNGRDYHFLSRAEFETHLHAGDFLEHALVHGNYYGTLRSAVLKKLEAGIDVLLDIDVQGADRIRMEQGPIRDALVDVFLMPENMDTLRYRLQKRGTESPEQMALRLQNAVTEMEAWPRYTYRIVSGLPEEDAANFRAIMRAERLRSRNQFCA